MVQHSTLPKSLFPLSRGLEVGYLARIRQQQRCKNFCLRLLFCQQARHCLGSDLVLKSRLARTLSIIGSNKKIAPPAAVCQEIVSEVLLVEWKELSVQIKSGVFNHFLLPKYSMFCCCMSHVIVM